MRALFVSDRASPLSVALLLFLATLLGTTAAADAGPNVEIALEHDAALDAGFHGFGSPTKRYGAPLVAVPEHRTILVSHGYMYDHARGKASWLEDVWTFAAPSPLPPGTTGRTASGAWTRRPTTGASPSPRYKHSLAYSDGHVVLFGGDDGGSREGAKTHMWGAFSDDLQLLDVATWAWRRVPGGQLWRQEIQRGTLKPSAAAEAAGAASVAWPNPRAGHSADMVGGAMLLFGGIVSTSAPSAEGGTSVVHSNDLWSLDVAAALALSRRLSGDGDAGAAPSPTPLWTRRGLSEPRPHDRRSHVTTVYTERDGTQRLILFGGYHHSGGDPKSGERNDLWSYNPATDTWTELAPQNAPNAPLTRAGGAVSFHRATRRVVVYGGGTCHPSCHSLGDAVVFDLATNAWLPHASRPALLGDFRPVPRYFIGHATLPDFPTFGDDSIFVFGGESYSPYNYWNDLWSVRLRGGSKDGAALALTGPGLLPTYYDGRGDMASNLQTTRADDSGANSKRLRKVTGRLAAVETGIGGAVNAAPLGYSLAVLAVVAVGAAVILLRRRRDKRKMC